MGKGTISSHLGDSEYSVQVDTGASQKAEALDLLSTRKASLESRVTNYTDAVAVVVAERVDKQAELDSLIDADAPTNEMGKAAADLAILKTKESKLTAQLNIAAAQLAYVDRRIAKITAIDTSASKPIWCADYNESGTGTVSLIDINADTQETVIAPGCPPHSPIYGKMVNRNLQSGPQLFYNAATLPGTQKFLPTYRVGEITSLSTGSDTCNVTLEPALSTEQEIDINQATSLTAVPIEYMTCNAGAFEVGDRVVVQFQNQNWANPKVIGFVTNPRPCSGELLCFPAFVTGTRYYRTEREATGSAGLLDSTSELTSSRVLESTLSPSGFVTLLGTSIANNVRDLLHHDRVMIYYDGCWQYRGSVWYDEDDGSIQVAGGNVELWPTTDNSQVDISIFNSDPFDFPSEGRLVSTLGEYETYDAVYQGPILDENLSPDTGSPFWTPSIYPGDIFTAEAINTETFNVYTSSAFGDLDKIATTAKILSRYNIPQSITVTEDSVESEYNLLWVGAAPTDLVNPGDSGSVAFSGVNWIYESVYVPKPSNSAAQFVESNNFTNEIGPVSGVAPRTMLNQSQAKRVTLTDGPSDQNWSSLLLSSAFMVVYEKAE